MRTSPPRSNVRPLKASYLPLPATSLLLLARRAVREEGQTRVTSFTYINLPIYINLYRRHQQNSVRHTSPRDLLVPADGMAFAPPVQPRGWTIALKTCVCPSKLVLPRTGWSVAVCGLVASRSAPTSTASCRLDRTVKRPQLLRLRALAVVLSSESHFADKALEVQPALLTSV